MDTIVYVGGELPDKNAAAHRVLNNAKAFRSLGYNVVLIGLNSQLAWGTPVLDTGSEYEGFHMFFVPYPKSGKQWFEYIFNAKDIISVCKKQANVKAIILYNHPSASMFKIKRYAKGKGIKLLADVTEWYPGLDGGFIHRTVKKLDTKLRMEHIQKRLDGLIVISRFLEDYYKQCKNVQLIPPLIDLEEEKWKVGEAKQQSTTLRLVYAGNPGKKDSLNELITAVMRLNRPVQLDIIGIDRDAYRNIYKEEAIDEDKDKVKFLGRLPHLDTIKRIKQSDYSCFFREDNLVSKAGFPTKFGEALACGVGVITNRTSDLEEYMGEGRNGFFVEDLNAESIASLFETIPQSVSVESDLFDYHKYIGKLAQLL